MQVWEEKSAFNATGDSKQMVQLVILTIVSMPRITIIGTIVVQNVVLFKLLQDKQYKNASMLIT